MRPPTVLQPLAPHIEDPIELLLACHDKVRRFSALALRLRDHVQQAQGEVDAQAREAAAAILRYFEIAAPLHHQDEENDLFPALRLAASDPALHDAITALQAEHEALNQAWRSLAPWLEALSQGQRFPAPDSVSEFASRQAAHAQREETQVYPFAAHLSPQQIKSIASAMVKRRTQG